MDIVADLIESEDNGVTLDDVPTGTLSGAAGDRLAVVMAAVQTALQTQANLQIISDANSNPYLTRSAYETVLAKALKDATADQNPWGDAAPADAPTIHVKRGPFVPSTWVPSLNNWDEVDGAAAELRLFEAAMSRGVLTLTAIADLPTYYLNVRPRDQDLRASCTCSVPARGLESADGLYLYFAPTRTVLESVEVAGGRCTPAPERVRRVGASGGPLVRLEGPLYPNGGCFDFRLRFIGDPPYVRASTILTKDGPRIPEAPKRERPSDPLPTPPALASTDSRAALETYRYSFEEALEHRRFLVSQQKEFRADHEFFLELDERTHPEAPATQEKIAQSKPGTFDFLRLGAALAARYKRRAQHAHFGTELELGPELVASQLDEAKAAGELIRQLLYNAFGEDGSCELDRTAAAFERFAGGELALFDTHGAPNGTNFFSFAELALFLAEAGVDPEAWKRLFVVFARTAEVFAVCYHGCRQLRTLCSYRVENNPDGYRAPGAQTKADIARAWTPRTARRRYAELVRAALQDDLIAAFGPGTPKGALTLNDLGC